MMRVCLAYHDAHLTVGQLYAFVVAHCDLHHCGYGYVPAHLFAHIVNLCGGA